MTVDILAGAALGIAVAALTIGVAEYRKSPSHPPIIRETTIPKNNAGTEQWSEAERLHIIGGSAKLQERAQ